MRLLSAALLVAAAALPRLAGLRWSPGGASVAPGDAPVALQGGGEGAPPPKELAQKSFSKLEDLKLDPVGKTGRSNCAYLFYERYKWHDKGNLVQMGFYLFLLLPPSIEQLTNAQHEATEKSVLYTLDTVSSWTSFGIDGRKLDAITSCDVDQTNGRTIAMKLVQLGLTSSLDAPFAQKYLFTRRTVRFRDAFGNNLLHLAAMSESTATVRKVMNLLYMRGYVSPKEVVEMMEEKNSNGQRPYDIAQEPISLRPESPHFSLGTSQMLKAFYYSARLFAGIQDSLLKSAGCPPDLQVPS